MDDPCPYNNGTFIIFYILNLLVEDHVKERSLHEIFSLQIVFLSEFILRPCWGWYYFAIDPVVIRLPSLLFFRQILNFVMNRSTMIIFWWRFHSYHSTIHLFAFSRTLWWIAYPPSQKNSFFFIFKLKTNQYKTWRHFRFVSRRGKLDKWKAIAGIYLAGRNSITLRHHFTGKLRFRFPAKFVYLL